MTKVIGVRFRQASKIYFFAPGKLQIEKGDQVIVETARGVEFGNVVVGPKEVPDEEIMQPLKSVIRVATEEDKKKYTTDDGIGVKYIFYKHDDHL